MTTYFTWQMPKDSVKFTADSWSGLLKRVGKSAVPEPCRAVRVVLYTNLRTTNPQAYHRTNVSNPFRRLRLLFLLLLPT